MKKSTLLILCAALFLSACERESPKEKPETPPTASTSTETTDHGGKDNSSKLPDTDELVQEMEDTKGKIIQLPKLNEDLLGTRAKGYNLKIPKIYKEWEEFGMDSEDGEASENILYTSYLDEERKLFSVVTQFTDPRGYLTYEPVVFDLKDPAREITFSEILKRYDWDANAFRERVESYFKNLYAYDIQPGNGTSDLPIQDFEVYLKERMNQYDEEVSEGLPFSIDKEGPTVYFTTAYPTFMETHTQPYRIRKNFVDDLFANRFHGAMMAIVNMSTKTEQEQLNIVDRIQPEGRVNGMIEKIFVALEDDVDFYVRTLTYDEASDRVKPNDSIYRRTLKKGEAISVLAFVSEGIPRLEAVGEHRPKDLEIDGSYTFFYDFTYNGLYGEVKIQFLQGEFGNG